ncbi:MAG: hypothetical protein ACK4RK_09570 [Gemmataceae bacterium]
MMEVNVTLEFTCCHCHHSISVTLRCAGQGLNASRPPVAVVNIPCPNCGSVNKLSFEPTGLIHDVEPVLNSCFDFAPSIN